MSKERLGIEPEHQRHVAENSSTNVTGRGNRCTVSACWKLDADDGQKRLTLSWSRRRRWLTGSDPCVFYHTARRRSCGSFILVAVRHRTFAVRNHHPRRGHMSARRGGWVFMPFAWSIATQQAIPTRGMAGSPRDRLVKGRSFGAFTRRCPGTVLNTLARCLLVLLGWMWCREIGTRFYRLGRCPHSSQPYVDKSPSLISEFRGFGELPSREIWKRLSAWQTCT